MFDSEYVPLVTRIEAGLGVLVQYTANDAGEGVWKTSLDSDYVKIILDKALSLDSNSLLSVADRLRELEELFGVTFIPDTGTIPSDSDSSLGFITFTQPTLTNATPIVIRWCIQGFDGSDIISKDITIASNSTTEAIQNIILYSILKHPTSSRYLATLRLDDTGTDQKIAFKFFEKYRNLSFKVSLTSAPAGTKVTVKMT